jgi:uncharacterized protein YegP (UPF0339 family)
LVRAAQTSFVRSPIQGETGGRLARGGAFRFPWDAEALRQRAGLETREPISWPASGVFSDCEIKMAETNPASTVHLAGLQRIGKETKMGAKYELKRARDEQFLFNLKAPNGEVILTSERHTAKHNAQAGIESVKTNSALDERYERRESTRSEPYFVLKAKNGEIIGRSEMYSSTGAMENGIRSVKENGPIASVDDLT